MRSAFRKLNVGGGLVDVLANRGQPAFPQLIAAHKTNWRNLFTGTPTLQVPNDCLKGDQLIAMARSTQGAGTVTWPAGWTELLDNTSDGSTDTVGVAYHTVDGTEGDSFARVSPVFSGGSARFAAVALQIRGGKTPELGGFVAAATTTPNPGNLALAGGVAVNALWIACASSEDYRASSAPANYSGYDESICTADEVTPPGGAAVSALLYAFRELNASAENPGAFGAMAASLNTMSWTIGIPVL